MCMYCPLLHVIHLMFSIMETTINLDIIILMFSEQLNFSRYLKPIFKIFLSLSIIMLIYYSTKINNFDVCVADYLYSYKSILPVLYLCSITSQLLICWNILLIFGKNT